MPNANTPIYLQIAQYVENEILLGALTPEEQVPSTNDFSRIMDVNPATAGKGLNHLVEQDILYKKRGLGMFVTTEAPSIIRKKRQLAFRKERLPQLIREARQLDISMEELITMIRSEENA